MCVYVCACVCEKVHVGFDDVQLSASYGMPRHLAKAFRRTPGAFSSRLVNTRRTHEGLEAYNQHGSRIDKRIRSQEKSQVNMWASYSALTMYSNVPRLHVIPYTTSYGAHTSDQVPCNILQYVSESLEHTLTCPLQARLTNTVMCVGTRGKSHKPVFLPCRPWTRESTCFCLKSSSALAGPVHVSAHTQEASTQGPVKCLTWLNCTMQSKGCFAAWMYFAVNMRESA